MDHRGLEYLRRQRSREDILHRGQVFTPAPVVELLLELAELRAPCTAQVLDPACGSGSILLGLAPRMTPGGSATGIDLCPTLLALARESLAEQLPGGVPPDVLTLREADALSLADELAARFDCVVANPPYVGWHRIPRAVRDRLRTGFLETELVGRPSHADSQPDLSLFFLLLGLHALRPGGRLVYLLPQEWLSAPRALPARQRLQEWGEIRLAISFAPSLALFEDPANRANLSPLILVANRRPPAASGPSRAENRPFLHLAVEGGKTVRRARLRSLVDTLRQVPQTDLEASGDLRQLETRAGPGIRARLERPETFLGLPREPRRTASWRPRLAPVASEQSLAETPGVWVLGGHQPRVAWLQWLELDAEAVEGLDPLERSCLVPACPSLSERDFPLLGPTGRAWVMPPQHWTEAELARRAPRLYTWMRARARVGQAADGAGETNTNSPSPDWWRFPNPRNLKVLSRGGPSLLAPRTASRATFCWDAHGHHIKGTHTMIRVSPDSIWTLEALFAYLNSDPMRDWCRDHGRSYHGQGLRQEPRDVSTLPLPRVNRTDHGGWLDALATAVRPVLQGLARWEAVSMDIHHLLRAL